MYNNRFDRGATVPLAVPALPPPSASQFSRVPPPFGIVKITHIVASIVHGLSAIALLILKLTLSNTDEIPALLFSDTPVYDANGTIAVFNKELAGSRYDLFWILLSMAFSTSVFHAIQWVLSFDNTEWAYQYRQMVIMRINPVRWVEYSITAGLMTWIICQLSGISNVYLVWTIGITLNVVMQFHGLFYEWLDAYSPQTSKMVILFNSFVAFFGQWGIIACYFARTLIAAESTVPWFVTVSFIGLIATFLMFPVFMIWWREILRNMFCVMMPTWIHYEVGFNILSALSKLFLDWTLFAAIIST